MSAVATRSIHPTPSGRSRRVALATGTVLGLLVLCWWATTHLNLNPRYRVGQEVDRFNGVAVFYNGGIAHSSGRNLAPDGYNLGIKFQCVEFVKRYYYEHLNHKMPDSYGHAKQFFDPTLPDGALNTHRDLLQFTNGGASKPCADDLLVLGPSLLNRYGHVAVVSQVTDAELYVVQQNPGPFGSSREKFLLTAKDGRWRCENRRVLGWLRKVPNQAVKRTEGGRSPLGTNQTPPPDKLR